MHEKANNATCKSCGQEYHICDGCGPAWDWHNWIKLKGYCSWECAPADDQLDIVFHNEMSGVEE